MLLCWEAEGRHALGAVCMQVKSESGREGGVVSTDGSGKGTRMDSFGDRKMFFLCNGPI